MLKTIVKTITVLALMAASALAQQPPVKHYLIRMEVVRTDLTLQNMTPDEQKIAGQHFQYWKALQTEQKLVFGGQVFDPKGLKGILVVNAADQATADALLNGDPGVKIGMFRGDAVPFRAVFTTGPAPVAPTATGTR